MASLSPRPPRQLSELGPCWRGVQACLLGPLTEADLAWLLHCLQQRQPSLLQELHHLPPAESPGCVWSQIDAILTPELSSVTGDLDRQEKVRRVMRLFDSLRREFLRCGRPGQQLQPAEMPRKRMALAEIPLSSVVRNKNRQESGFSSDFQKRPFKENEVFHGFRDSNPRSSKNDKSEGKNSMSSLFDKMEQSAQKATKMITSDTRQRKKNVLFDDKENSHETPQNMLGCEHQYVDKVKLNLSKLFAKLDGDDAPPSEAETSTPGPGEGGQKTAGDVTSAIWDLFAVEDLKDKSRSLVPTWVEFFKVAQEVLSAKSGLEVLQGWVQPRAEALSEQLLLLASAKLSEEEAAVLEEAVPDFVRHLHAHLHRRLLDNSTSDPMDAQSSEEDERL